KVSKRGQHRAKFCSEPTIYTAKSASLSRRSIGFRRHGGRASRHWTSGATNRNLLFPRHSWSVPVVCRLPGEDSIEDESSNEAIENELVVYFLHGGEDT